MIVPGWRGFDFSGDPLPCILEPGALEPVLELPLKLFDNPLSDADVDVVEPVVDTTLCGRPPASNSPGEVSLWSCDLLDDAFAREPPRRSGSDLALFAAELAPEDKLSRKLVPRDGRCGPPP